MRRNRGQDALDVQLGTFGAVWIMTSERPLERVADPVATLATDGVFARVYREYGAWRWAVDTGGGLLTTSCALKSVVDARLHASVEVLRVLERRYRQSIKILATSEQP
jgi:hypothetical protein